MTNSEITVILLDIAALLRRKKDNIFKVRSYENAVSSIESQAEPVEKLVAGHRLRQVPGIGEAIEKKITELVATGRLEYYEKLKAEFPAEHGTESTKTGIDRPGVP